MANLRYSAPIENKATYFLATGEADKLRLEILNRLYNPGTQRFLLVNGLQKGMKVLEIGCGIGIMACWLASQVGETGKVIAIDNSAEQLTIAQENAKTAGLNNIDFIQLDLRKIDQLREKFDLSYGRWVAGFVEHPLQAFQAIYDLLKPEGILTYEGLSLSDTGHFSYPHHEIIDRYFKIARKMVESANLSLDFANNLFPFFQQLGCKEIAVAANQPILVSSEEKSIFRLGILSRWEVAIKKGIYTEVEANELLNELVQLENHPVIIGFYRNILIKGRK